MTRSLFSLTEYAWEIARKSNQRKKHVSVIMEKNEIISAKANGFEVPDAYAYRGDRSLHSEIHAFMKITQRNNLTLYNFRFSNQGKLRMAKPCKICMPWCEAIFEHIYYSTNKGVIVKLVKGTSNVSS